MSDLPESLKNLVFQDKQYSIYEQSEIMNKKYGILQNKCKNHEHNI